MAVHKNAKFRTCFKVLAIRRVQSTGERSNPTHSNKVIIHSNNKVTYVNTEESQVFRNPTSWPVL